MKRFCSPSHWTLAQRLEHYTDKSGGPEACWPWRGHHGKKGYGRLRWKGKKRQAHKLAWESENGKCMPDGMNGLHKCDNPPCCNPAHIFPGTAADNAADCIAKGRDTRCFEKDHHNCRLSNEQITAILMDMRSQRQIADTYGVSQQYVSRIKRRERRTHGVELREAA